MRKVYFFGGILTSGQKTTLSVLITVLLFGVITIFAFTELFSIIDSRFYEPAKISKISKKLDSISKSYDEYVKTLDARFATGESAYLKNSCIASFVESRPTDSDVKKRTELTGDLRSTTRGLMGIRVVDKNLSSIHYSTFRDDILRQNLEENLVAYKNYGDVTTNLNGKEIPMSELATEDTSGNIEKGARAYYDGANGRIVFSYPFYDKYLVFRGTILFYLSAEDFGNILVKQNLLSVGEPFNFIANENAHGFALGIPSVAYDEFVTPILNAWKENKTSAQKLFAINDTAKNKNYWIMVTSLAGKDTFVSEIFNDEILVLPLSARVLILLCAFATIYLIVFFVLNLRRDDMTVIRERIVTLQLGVVDEYLKRKSDLNLNSISGKRAAVTKEILESLGKRGKLHRQQVEELINRSWDELLTAMNLAPKQQVQSATFSQESTEEIKNMLQEILSSGNIKVQAVGGVSSGLTTVSQSAGSTVYASPADDVEDLEEVESLEEVEELGDVEPLEEVEEVGAADEIEEVEVVEELEEIDAPVESDVEEIEELEELDDTDNATAELTEAFEDILDSDDDLAAAVAMDDTKPIEEVSFDDMFITEDFFGPSKPKPVHSLEEMFDISEDVSADFFAVKTEKPLKRSGLLSRAEMMNSELNNDFEEDETVLNFTTGLPFFEMDESDNESLQDDEQAKEKSSGSLLARAMMIAATEKNDDVVDDEVIKQDNDGVYLIKANVETDGVVQDNSFKRLVDSVLNN